MAGNQTHGFDMVIEVSTQTIQNLLSATFDNNGLLGSIIPENLGILEEFGLDVSFNRPSGLPSGAVNPIELMFNLKLMNGIEGMLDVVVGMDVDRAASNFDKVMLDFKNKLYKCELTFPGVPQVVLNSASNWIKNKLGELVIPLMPIPVNRTSTSTTTIKRADVKVIDDSTINDNDSLGVILTYGGGTPGNIDGFTTSFARKGAGAAIAINFAWICRTISPKVEAGIGLPAGSFKNCSFSGSHEIKDGVKLTRLSVSAAEDHLVLSGKVSKDGTCYDATGSFKAKIFVSIVGGELRVSYHADDPDIDIDIPWYCWVGLAVIGGLTGGVIFGVIGAVVGTVLIPLLLWIAESVIESTIENVAGRVTNAINGMDAISVDLVGVNTVLDKAFIDDLTITYNMYSEEYWPVKASGTVTLLPGDYLDLDTGMVKKDSFGGADLRLEGRGSSRSVRVLCGTSVTDLRTSLPFNNIRRYHLQMLNYGTYRKMPRELFASYFSFIISYYSETKRMFAVKTSDNSFAFFQVVLVDNDKFVLRYKTYKSAVYTIDFAGKFRCPMHFSVIDVLKPVDSYYVDAKVINTKLYDTLAKEYEVKSEPELKNPNRTGYQEMELSQNLRLANPVYSMEDVRPADRFKLDASRSLLAVNKAVGVWYDRYVTVREKKTANFTAMTTGGLEVASLTWTVDNISLPQNESGKIKIKNHNFEFKTQGKVLQLSSEAEAEIEIAIKLTIIFANGLSDYIIKCVSYKNDCEFVTRKVSLFEDFLERYDKEYGTVMV